MVLYYRTYSLNCRLLGIYFPADLTHPGFYFLILFVKSRLTLKLAWIGQLIFQLKNIQVFLEGVRLFDRAEASSALVKQLCHCHLSLELQVGSVEILQVKAEVIPFEI